MNRSPDWPTARALAFNLADALPAETVRLADAAGRTLIDALSALVDVPHYASSAMDGWAVAGEAPWRLNDGSGELLGGEAREIVTGGLIPVGALGVLRSENGVLDRGSAIADPAETEATATTTATTAATDTVTVTVTVTDTDTDTDTDADTVADTATATDAATDADADAASAAARLDRGGPADSPASRAFALLDRGPAAFAGEPAVGQHIRPAGEEVRQGAEIIAAGTVLNPVHLAVAAIAGHDTLQVRRRPRVGLILSGSEVVEVGIPAPGFVRDAFGPQLPAFIGQLGGVVVGRLRIGDDRAQTAAAFGPGATGLTAAETDLLVTTGGTSNSSADHMRQALASVGATIVIDGIRMRPGGPTFVAQLVDGRFVACLPGNPLAAMMGLLTVVGPLIAGLRGDASGGGKGDARHEREIGRGLEPEDDRELGHRLGLGTTILSHDIAAAKGNSRLLPFREIAGRAVVSDWLGSGMLRGLAEADAVLVCPPAGAQTGETVTTLLLPWTRPAR